MTRFPAAVLAAALCSATPAVAMSGKPVEQATRAHVAPSSTSAARPASFRSFEPDVVLVKTLMAIRNNQLDGALVEVENVLQA